MTTSIKWHSALGKNTVLFMAMLLIVLFGQILLTAESKAQANVEMLGSRRALASEIIQLLRLDDRPAALNKCRVYCQQYPTDSAMLYNLACLENTAGNTAGNADQAMIAFKASVANGFDNFAVAESDSDLLSLISMPAYQDIVQNYRAKMETLVKPLSRELALDQWSEPITLGSELKTSKRPGKVSFNWSTSGLDVKIVTSEPWYMSQNASAVPAWQGGPGVVVVVAIPNNTSEFESNTNFSFAFGNATTYGGAFLMPGQNRWQQIRQLKASTEQRTTADQNPEYIYSAHIPWQIVLPYHPLADSKMGINVALNLAVGNSAALLQDPNLVNTSVKTRRFISLKFLANTITDNRFGGRVRNTVLKDLPLEFQLVANSVEAGQGTLTIEFLDDKNNSILPEGATAGSVDLVQGINSFSQQADFSQLATGMYLLKAQLVFPSGLSAVWSTQLLQIAPDFGQEVAEQLTVLSVGDEIAILEQMKSIEESLSERSPRSSPGPIATTIEQMLELLVRAGDTGTILPESGLFPMIYAGPNDQKRFCTLYLPEGYRDCANVVPILVLNNTLGSENLIGEILGNKDREMLLFDKTESSDCPVYIIPHFVTTSGNLKDSAAAEAEACLDWALEYFETISAAVAGLDFSAGTALRLAIARTAEIRSIFVITAGEQKPWDSSDSDYVKQRITELSSGLPISWVEFVQSAAVLDPNRNLRSLLDGAGCDLSDLRILAQPPELKSSAEFIAAWARKNF